MRYIKKLIVLSGQGKGVLTLEKTSSEVIARFSAYGYNKGLLGVIFDDGCVVRDYGGGTLVFSIQNDISRVHCALVVDQKVCLYGTTQKERMWEANVLQLINRNDVLQEPSNDYNYYQGLPLYNERVERFLDGERVTQLDDVTQQVLSYAKREQIANEPIKLNELTLLSNKEDNNKEDSIKEEGDIDLSSILKIDEDGVKKEIVATQEICEDDLPYKKQAKFLAEYFENVAIVPPTKTVYPLLNQVAPPALRKATTLENYKNEVDGLFKIAPRVVELEKLLPSTEWAKIQLDESSFVAVGVINDRLCYGVLGEYGRAPDHEDVKFVPINPKQPTAKGFWLMFDV